MERRQGGTLRLRGFDALRLSSFQWTCFDLTVQVTRQERRHYVWNGSKIHEFGVNLLFRGHFVWLCLILGWHWYHFEINEWFRITMRRHWGHFGVIVGVRFIYEGDSWSLWYGFGITLGSLWRHFGSLWGHFVLALGCLRGHFGYMKVTLGPVGVILGRLCCRFWLMKWLRVIQDGILLSPGYTLLWFSVT